MHDSSNGNRYRPKLIGRTMRWVGVAIVVYDYANCLNNKRNS